MKMIGNQELQGGHRRWDKVRIAERIFGPNDAWDPDLGDDLCWDQSFFHNTERLRALVIEMYAHRKKQRCGGRVVL